MGEAVLTRRKGAASKKITVDGASYPYTNSAAVSGKSVTINTSAAVTNEYSNIATFTPTINNLWYMRVKVVFPSYISVYWSSAGGYVQCEIAETTTQTYKVVCDYVKNREVVLGEVNYEGGTYTLNVKVVLSNSQLRFVYSWNKSTTAILSATAKVEYEIYWD